MVAANSVVVAASFLVVAANSVVVAASFLVVAANSALVAIPLAYQSYSTHQIPGSLGIVLVHATLLLAQMPLLLENFARVRMRSPGLR